MKKISIKKYNLIGNGGWPEIISMEDAAKEHAKNIIAWKKAFQEYNEVDRPLRILAIHGSGRANVYGSAKHRSERNSQSAFLLQQSLKVVKEIDPKIEIEEIFLIDYNISACINCVSVTSGLCGAPCDCHPIDDMQKIYPKLIRSDIHLISTGVNQSAMSSRLKLMVDRMISLDGGYFRDNDQFGKKDDKLVTKMMLLAESGHNAYDQRLRGRVGGYFIASKDDANNHTVTNSLQDKDGIGKYGYIRTVSYALKDGMESYGYFHDPKYWVGAAANFDIDYMYDRETLLANHKSMKAGRLVIKRAIELAKKLKKNGMASYSPDRINRT